MPPDVRQRVLVREAVVTLAVVCSWISALAALHACQSCNTVSVVKTLTVRLPEPLVAQIDAESRERKISKSDVIRERLQAGSKTRRRRSAIDAIVDLIGSVEGLPVDLSARKKDYLKATRYGRKRPR